MCDCYYHKCSMCGEELPVHIGDFRFDRGEVEVFCGKHLPSTGATVFTNTETHDAFGDMREEQEGFTMAIRLRNGELEPDANDTHPNVGANQSVRVLPAKKMDRCPEDILREEVEGE